MGSRIACHFANIGVQVLLLDIAPRELLSAEEQKGLTLDAPAVRNRLVNSALQSAIAANPSPLYRKADARLIKTGNLDDDLKDIAGCDWTIEVVVERLDIKKSLYERVEQFRRPGTLITSNTSGIPDSPAGRRALGGFPAALRRHALLQPTALPQAAGDYSDARHAAGCD